MAQIIVFPVSHRAPVSAEVQLSEAKIVPTDAAQASLFLARHVRKSIADGKQLTAIEVDMVAQSLYEISEEWHCKKRLTRDAQAKALTGASWDKTRDSTKRLYKYTLPPGSGKQLESRRRSLVKKASAYVRAIENLAKASGEDVDWLVTRVFRGTSLVGSFAVDELDDHLLRTEKLLRSLTQAIVRDEQLEEYFRLLYRYPLRFDLEVQRFAHASEWAMERGPLMDLWARSIEDLAPSPNCLLLRQYAGNSVEGVLTLSNQPLGSYNGISPTGQNESTSNLSSSISIKGTARIVRETRLCIAPWLHQNDFAPAFEILFGLSVNAVSAQALDWISTCNLPAIDKEQAKLGIIEPIYISGYFLPGDFAEHGYTGKYACFVPTDKEQDFDWSPPAESGFCELWWTWCREVSPETISSIFSESSRPKLGETEINYSPLNHWNGSSPSFSTWPPRTLGSLIEHDLLTAAPNGIEATLRQSAIHLKSELDRVARITRGSIDAAAEDTMTRWHKKNR
ncbi:MAG: hypothetical protein SGJ03_15400 [Alphaproteobacteria bacterium]|nr:hypothetical protein [Alphaproteobacteria bacterium]